MPSAEIHYRRRAAGAVVDRALPLVIIAFALIGRVGESLFVEVLLFALAGLGGGWLASLLGRRWAKVPVVIRLTVDGIEFPAVKVKLPWDAVTGISTRPMWSLLGGARLFDYPRWWPKRWRHSRAVYFGFTDPASVIHAFPKRRRPILGATLAKLGTPVIFAEDFLSLTAEQLATAMTRYAPPGLLTHHEFKIDLTSAPSTEP